MAFKNLSTFSEGVIAHFVGITADGDTALQSVSPAAGTAVLAIGVNGAGELVTVDVGTFVGPPGDDGPPGDEGPAGNDGWSPILAVVADGERRVQQVVDWTGGEGTKPAVGLYVGATGLVPLIASGVDIRGAAGAAGTSPTMVANAYDTTSGRFWGNTAAGAGMFGLGLSGTPTSLTELNDTTIPNGQYRVSTVYAGVGALPTPLIGQGCVVRVERYSNAAICQTVYRQSATLAGGIWSRWYISSAWQAWVYIGPAAAEVPAPVLADALKVVRINAAGTAYEVVPLSAIMPDVAGNYGRVLEVIGTGVGAETGFAWRRPGRIDVIVVTDADKTLASTEIGSYIRMESATGRSLNVPLDATDYMPNGTTFIIRQGGAGQITVVPEGGVTVRTNATLKSRMDESTITLTKISDNQWDLAGDLEQL